MSLSEDFKTCPKSSKRIRAQVIGVVVFLVTLSLTLGTAAVAGAQVVDSMAPILLALASGVALHGPANAAAIGAEDYARAKGR